MAQTVHLFHGIGEEIGVAHMEISMCGEAGRVCEVGPVGERGTGGHDAGDQLRSAGGGPKQGALPPGAPRCKVAGRHELPIGMGLSPEVPEHLHRRAHGGDRIPMHKDEAGPGEPRGQSVGGGVVPGVAENRCVVGVLAVEPMKGGPQRGKRAARGATGAMVKGEQVAVFLGLFGEDGQPISRAHRDPRPMEPLSCTLRAVGDPVDGGEEMPNRKRGAASTVGEQLAEPGGSTAVHAQHEHR